MAKVLKINEGVTEGITSLLRTLLEEKKIRAVLTLIKEDPSGNVTYSLITDPEKLKDAVPFYPLMPQNAGKLLSRITLIEPFSDTVAVVLRPCELRAFVELIKRMQGSLINVVTISYACPGVYPLKMFAQGEVENQLSDYWSSVSREEPVSGIRQTCKSCEYFMPMGADITVAIAGEENIDDGCRLFINTGKAAELVEGIQGEYEEMELESEKITQILGFRKKQKEELIKETEGILSGLDGLVEVFATCIGCHGCREVCPICYCQLCEFDSERSEYRPENYETELRKRGGIRVPPGTLAFQIGRMVHMGISCVGCGMCSDVCPADIPVSSIFIKAGESAQKLFDYIPGRNIEEEIPITTFEEKELSEVED